MKSVQIIKVLLPKVHLFPLYYLAKDEYQVKDLVLVPFRNKEITGIVWEIKCIDPKKTLKQVISHQSCDATISHNLIRLIQQSSDYYLVSLGAIAKLVLPVDINEPPIKQITHIFDHGNINLAPLSDAQDNILKQIINITKPILLQGVTGSGKTEIYFYAIYNHLIQNKQILILLPEIALTTQIITRFTKRFGFEPAIWNSTVTKAKKKRILRGILSGDVKVVIGTRSALFLPYKNLGIIVVDEEHDLSYKQSDGILYHARDMAVLRASIEKCQVILTSATPSIESIQNARLNKYHFVQLNDRFHNATLPNVEIIDMKNENLAKNSWLSTKVVRQMKHNIRNKEQVLIFLNRRGYAPLVLCTSCDYRLQCKSCSVAMVMHKATNKFECHHCGFNIPIFNTCPECEEQNKLILCGPGVERIEEEVRSLFPNNTIAIATKEQSDANNTMHDITLKMAHKEIDILIGTQIITKGYHFPGLTLVVVVDADIGFIGGDLRASERTFQLLNQVGGRAGREGNNGLMLLQTYCANNKVMQSIANQDCDAFMNEEIAIRNTTNMPPFTKMAAIHITGSNSDYTLQAAETFRKFAPKIISHNDDQLLCRILGPAEAITFKLAGKYRYKILVITSKKFNLQKYLKLWLSYVNLGSRFHLKIDIDPYNFI